MQKKQREQVFRDPIYGYIHINYEIITKLIDTSIFQRLRRIRQLSGVHMVFHTAEHTRFSHSLGVYEVANKYLEISEIKNSLNQREQLMLLVAALLHDIGHGPYSHAFEHTFKVDHEKIGATLILEHPELRKILDQVDLDFANDVAAVILRKSKYPIIEQMISSQLDADRLDYLERDAYFTGAAYGHIDLDRLLRVATVINNQIVYKVSGVPAIENFLLSRAHMHYQVYYHPKARAYEAILEKIYLRTKDLLETNFIFQTDVEPLRAILHDPNDYMAYLQIDDFYMNGLISRFVRCDDEILRTLANDFLNRKIWKFIDVNANDKKLIDKIKESFSADELKYFTAQNQVSVTTYKESGKHQAIMILLENGKIVKLSEYSTIMHTVSLTNPKIDTKFFYKR